MANAPWCWPLWAERVSTDRAPWQDQGDNAHPFGWTERQVDQARSYVTKFSELRSAAARLTFARAKKDNEVDGRRLVNLALTRAWDRDWHLGRELKRVLTNHHMDMSSILAYHGERKVCRVWAVLRSPNYSHDRDSSPELVRRSSEKSSGSLLWRCLARVLSNLGPRIKDSSPRSMH